MDDVIRISRPEDLVAYIPYALGFRPTESVAFVGLRPDSPRLGPTTRADLAGLAHPEAGPALVAEVADCLALDGCDDAFVVIFTDEPRESLATHPVVRPALDLLRTLTTWAEPPGPWVVGAPGHGCWGEGEQCAPASASLTELEAGWIAATMVMHGKSLAPDRDSLHVPRSAPAPRRRAAVRAARRAGEALLTAEAAALTQPAPPGAAFGIPAPTPPGPLDQWRADAWRVWRRLVSQAVVGKELSPADLGSLAMAMNDARFRDAVLYTLTRPMPQSVPSVVMSITALDDVMTQGGPAPLPERVQPIETVLRASVACLGARLGAHPLAALAWLAWWCGDGARADVMSRQVLKARPGTRLAELVQQALAAHLPPGWVARAGLDSVGPPTFR